MVQYLKTIFKTIDNTNQFTNGLIMSNNDIKNVKNLIADNNLSEIRGFRIVDCDIEQRSDAQLRTIIEQVLHEKHLI